MISGVVFHRRRPLQQDARRAAAAQAGRPRAPRRRGEVNIVDPSSAAAAAGGGRPWDDGGGGTHTQRRRGGSSRRHSARLASQPPPGFKPPGASGEMTTTRTTAAPAAEATAAGIAIRRRLVLWRVRLLQVRLRPGVTTAEAPTRAESGYQPRRPRVGGELDFWSGDEMTVIQARLTPPRGRGVFAMLARRRRPPLAGAAVRDDGWAAVFRASPRIHSRTQGRPSRCLDRQPTMTRRPPRVTAPSEAIKMPSAAPADASDDRHGAVARRHARIPMGGSCCSRRASSSEQRVQRMR